MVDPTVSRRAWTTLVLLIAGAFPGGAQPTLAASFDCSKASTTRERTVCADPALSSADAELAEAYDDDLYRISPDAAPILRDDERQWLKSLDTICKSSGHKSVLEIGLDDYKTCLSHLYLTRINLLEDPIQVAGPFVFYMVHKIRDQRILVPDSNNLGPLESTADYPQIVNANMPALTAWNRSVAISLEHLPQCRGGWTRRDYSAEVNWATSSVISTAIHSVFYCAKLYGNADYTIKRRSERRILLTEFLYPTPHQILPKDLFKPGSDWRAFILNRVARLRGQERGSSEEQDKLPISVKRAALDTRQWVYSPYWLTITYEDEEIGEPPHVGEKDVTFWWSELKPFLSTATGLPTTSPGPPQ